MFGKCYLLSVLKLLHLVITKALVCRYFYFPYFKDEGEKLNDIKGFVYSSSAKI